MERPAGRERAPGGGGAGGDRAAGGVGRGLTALLSSRPMPRAATARPASATTRSPRARRSTAAGRPAPDPKHPLPHDELYARVLRALRRAPIRVVELTPLAGELGMAPQALQVELGRR